MFLGSKDFGLSCLKTLYQIAPDSLVGAITYDDSGDTRTALGEFRSFSQETGLQLKIAETSSHAERLVCEQSPDLCLVSGWYWLISEQTLAKLPRGFLGFHNSLLPRYRGAAPLVWAMINGDTVAGTSLFSFNQGIDDGPLWGQTSLKIEPTDYIADVTAKLSESATRLLEEKWLSILSGTAVAIEQDESQATYAALRKPEDGQIDWTWPAQKIHNFIRAQSKPYPGAFARMPDGRKVTIWRADCPTTPFMGTPGQVAQINKDNVYVMGGDHRPLVLQEIAVDGVDLPQPNNLLDSLKIRLH